MADDDRLISLTAGSLPLLQDLGDVLEVGILALDEQLVVRACNRWLASAAGMDASELIGQPLVELFPVLRDGAAEEALRRALAGSTTVWAHRFHHYFVPLPPPAGHESFTWMQQSARILPIMQDAAVHGVLVLVQDVTERVAREEALHSALRQAQVASQAKSEFLASMSHELRTPLSAIVGYMDLLEGEMVGAVAPLQKTFLGRVKAAARHLISVIEEILTFSRVEAGKEPVSIESVNASSLVRDVEEMFMPQALRKGLTLEMSVPDEALTLRTDSTKLRQILINLIGNALKFTDEGSVTLQLFTDGEMVSFVIRDTGPGIGATDLERIFDPFTQLDQSLRRTKGGTGLGLPVSRRLAHLLGGELRVESAAGEGAAFSLRVPIDLESDHSRSSGEHGIVQHASGESLSLL